MGERVLQKHAKDSINKVKVLNGSTDNSRWWIIACCSEERIKQEVIKQAAQMFLK